MLVEMTKWMLLINDDASGNSNEILVLLKITPRINTQKMQMIQISNWNSVIIEWRIPSSYRVARQSHDAREGGCKWTVSAQPKWTIIVHRTFRHALECSNDIQGFRMDVRASSVIETFKWKTMTFLKWNLRKCSASKVVLSNDSSCKTKLPNSLSHLNQFKQIHVQ